MRAGLFGFVIVAALGSASAMSSAMAQSTSSQLCSAYASQAVSTFQQGLLRGCNMGKSGLNADYGKMFDKCRNWPNVRTQSETRGLPMVLQVACKAPPPRPAAPPQAFGAPPAPPRAGGSDMSRHPICASFARFAAAHSRKAKSVGCNVATWHDNEAGHYKWCMGTTDASFRQRSPEARGFEADLKKHCAKQGRFF